jgi:hypothetical protein
MISKSIFKAYDIRGVIGKTLDADAATPWWSRVTVACRARN